MPLSLDALRGSCPAVRLGIVEEHEAIVFTQDQWEIGTRCGRATCGVTPGQLILAGVIDGCRGVTQVDQNGCPLRDCNSVPVTSG